VRPPEPAGEVSCFFLPCPPGLQFKHGGCGHRCERNPVFFKAVMTGHGAGNFTSTSDLPKLRGADAPAGVMALSH
jgi:hypothetical protein